MKVIAITSPGGPEVLQVRERDTPAVAGGDVLIQVEAAGVNRPDVMQRRGLYPPPPEASDLPGLEVAGRVVEVAGGNPAWHVGQAVCALVNGGGYAEFCTVPAEQCLPVPKGLSFIEAASLPETFFTVWSNLFQRGRLAAGESALIHGGASGIGVTAIQLAAARGNTVFATVGSAARRAAVEALGAERGIVYPEEDFVAVVQAATGGRGVDVVLDMVAGPYVGRELDCVAEEGRIVVISLQGGTRGEVDFNKLMRRRLTITGSTLRPRDRQFKGSIARALVQEVWPLIESGRVKPVIDRVFPLDRADEAHARMESGDHIGKIVLAVGPGADTRPG